MKDLESIVMYCENPLCRLKSLVRKLVRRAVRVQQRASAVGGRVNPKLGGETV